MLVSDPPPTPAASVEAAKAYLRVSGNDEDVLIAGLIASATALCERFLGSALVAREVIEVIPASSAWQRLALTPVRAISAVSGLDAAGSAVPIGADGYAVDIDSRGDGWVRHLASGASRLRVTYQAGIADDAEAIPEALRQGVVRLVAHLFTHRDAADDSGPPTAVAALWRPWRRMRLG